MIRFVYYISYYYDILNAILAITIYFTDRNKYMYEKYYKKYEVLRTK